MQLKTDSEYEGNGFTFTVGRGNEIGKYLKSVEGVFSRKLYRNEIENFRGNCIYHFRRNKFQNVEEFYIYIYFYRLSINKICYLAD